MTGRQFLQTVGEEARKRNPFHWVDRVQQTIGQFQIEFCEAAGVVAIVGDCRHPNEVDGMRPGLAIRLTGDPGGARARSHADMTHISETAMNGFDGFDMHIDTNTTLPEMAVLDVFQRLATDVPEMFADLVTAKSVKDDKLK
jgi:hypothetical protein